MSPVLDIDEKKLRADLSRTKLKKKWRQAGDSHRVQMSGIMLYVWIDRM